MVEAIPLIYRTLGNVDPELCDKVVGVILTAKNDEELDMELGELSGFREVMLENWLEGERDGFTLEEVIQAQEEDQEYFQLLLDKYTPKAERELLRLYDERDEREA